MSGSVSKLQVPGSNKPMCKLFQNCEKPLFQILAYLLWHFAFHTDLNLTHRKPWYSNCQLAQWDEWQCFKTAGPWFKSANVQTVPKLWIVLVSYLGLVIVTLCFPHWLELNEQKTMTFQLPISSVGWVAVLQNRRSLVQIHQFAKCSKTVKSPCFKSWPTYCDTLLSTLTWT